MKLFQNPCSRIPPCHCLFVLIGNSQVIFGLNLFGRYLPLAITGLGELNVDLGAIQVCSALGQGILLSPWEVMQRAMYLTLNTPSQQGRYGIPNSLENFGS